MKNRRLSAVVALLFLTASLASASVEVPPLAGPVVDASHLLPAAVAKQVSADLDRFKTMTGDAVVVLILPSLEAEALEAFSGRVTTTWKLAQKDLADHGVLLLVVEKERQVRIEVGGFYSGVLSETKGSRIIQDKMQPRFEAGDLASGVSNGVEAILNALMARDLPGSRGSWRDVTVSTFTATSMTQTEATLFMMGGVFRDIRTPASIVFGVSAGLIFSLRSMWAGAFCAALVGIMGPWQIMREQHRPFSDLSWWAVPTAGLIAVVATLSLFGLFLAVLKRRGIRLDSIVVDARAAFTPRASRGKHPSDPPKGRPRPRQP